MKGKFQYQLERLVFKKIILLIGAGAGLFMAGIMALNWYSNEHNAGKNMDMLVESFLLQYERNREFLSNPQIQGMCKAAIRDREKVEPFSYEVRRFHAPRAAASRVILSDTEGNVIYSTFPAEELNGYLTNYNGAVCYHAGENGSDAIYNAIYYEPGNYSDYIFVKPLKEGDELLGYLSLYLSGSDWNYILSENNYDGIITDSRDNIIYCSKASFMDNHGKFYTETGPYYHLGDERYWLRDRSLPEYGVTVFSLVYDPRSPVWIMGIVIVCVMGACWFGLVRSMSDSMAENNAKMINLLVSEIRIIQRGDSKHRIEIKTDNEFDEVARQINHMLDSMGELNEQNMELIRLNNTFELNQLMAQINPHFLYNTLEMIRNLVTWDPEKTSTLIVQLTQILRYSIDRNRQVVCLEEDISYLSDYIEIQKCRFSERFLCGMDIDQECLTCMVPKLILQPVIENSIKYGFKKKMDVCVSIRGYMEDHILRLEVVDDGPGMTPEEADQLNRSIRQVYKDTSSYGLHNISRRLYLQYGERSGVTVSAREGRGIKVTISIDQRQEG